MKLNKEMKFTDFCKELQIPANQYQRRKPELLEWLKNFFEYNYYSRGNAYFIVINEQIGEYQPLPRKKYDVSMRLEKTKEAKEQYETFTIASLGTEYKPNSQTKIARDGIRDFGCVKYGHHNYEWVARNYVKEPFEKYGQTNGKHYWVDYETYEPLDEDVVERWRTILKQEQIDEQDAANAFYRERQGENVDKEKGYFKKALERFQEEYTIRPVLVREWKLKQE